MTDASPAARIPSGVDVSTVARVLNVSTQRVNQLTKEAGFPPKLGRNEYDLQKITLWYIRHLQAELKRRGPTATAEGAELQSEKLNLVREQAEKARTENRVRRGELLTMEAVREVWTQRVANTQKRLRSIPTTEGPQLTNKSDPAYIVDRLKHAIDQALYELAGEPGGGPSSREPVSGNGVDTVRAASGIHGEPMGGRETPTIE